MELDEERGATLAVLMDVSAARKEVDEALAKAGDDVARAGKDILDGTGSHWEPMLTKALLALVRHPNWAHTTLVGLGATLAAEPGSAELRKCLVAMASTCVQWVECIDERTSK